MNIKVKLPSGETMIPPKAPSADELANSIRNGEKVINDLVKKYLLVMLKHKMMLLN